MIRYVVMGVACLFFAIIDVAQAGSFRIVGMRGEAQMKLMLDPSWQSLTAEIPEGVMVRLSPGATIILEELNSKLQRPRRLQISGPTVFRADKELFRDVRLDVNVLRQKALSPQRQIRFGWE